VVDSSRPVGTTIVGQRRVQPAAIGAFALGIVLTGTVVSSLIASRLQFNSELGRSVFWHVYDPLAWLRWLGMIYGPKCYNYLAHTGCYVPAVYAAFSDWLRLCAYGVGASAVTYAVVTARLAPRADKIKTLVDEAHFAKVDEIRKKTTLLSANCGPILGKVETIPRKTACFGLVTISPAKWEHLRGGESQTGVNIVGISGAGKTPDYMRQLLLNPQIHPEAESWSALERRVHPHGYEPNLVVFDLKGSLYKATSGYQKAGLKKNVLVFSPFSRDYALSKYNPLHFIRLTDEEEFDDCFTAGLDIVDEGQGLKDYWSKVALDFGAAIVATVGYLALALNRPTLFSHAGVVDYVSNFKTPDELIEDMLSREHDPHGVFGWDEYELLDASDYERAYPQGIMGGELRTKKTGKKTKQRQWILQAARVMHARAVEEKSGIFGSFISYIGVYRGPILREHISSTTFDLKAMANDPERASTVYIVMPDSDLERIRPFFRIMVKDMFRRLMTGCEVIEGREVPGNLRLTRFILDEVRALNRLEPLAMTAGFMRGHKVIVDLAWQTRSQLNECYGGQNGQNESISGNLGTQMYYQTIPGADAEFLSNKCGQTTFVLQHRNLSGKVFAPVKGQLGEQNNVQTAKNLTEYEASNLGKTKKILFVDGAIIKADQCRYYEYPELDRRARRPHVTTPDVLIGEAPYITGVRTRVGDEVFATLCTPPPDRWQSDRDEAEELPTGCRVRRSRSINKETGAWMYSGQIWYPNGIKPVLDKQFLTEEEREREIDEMLGLQGKNEPQETGDVFIPYTQDPAAAFELALGIGAE
jgi:type IV secretory pathway TraG/TraD family ATPase VirD4